MEFETLLALIGTQLIKIWPELSVAIFCLLSLRWYHTHKNEVLMHWPILDVYPSILANVHRIHHWIVDIANKISCTIVARGPVFGRLDVVLTSDPRNVDYILKTNFSNFPKGPQLKEAFDLLGDGIFNVDDDKWRLQKRLAHVALVSKEFRNFTGAVTRKLVQDALLPIMLHAAKHGTILDLEDLFMRFAFDSVFTAIFGRSPNSLSLSSPSNELAEAIDDGTEGIFYRHVMPRGLWKLLGWLKVGSERKMIEARKTIDHHLLQHISFKKEEMREGIQSSDLIAMYLTTQAQRGETSIHSEEFLRDTSLSFLFAGRDSTGTSLAWFLWLVSTTPHVEAKILEELKQVKKRKEDPEGLGARGTAEPAEWPWVFDSEDLKELVYLHAAMCESLRLNPPLPLTRRGVVKEDVLPDGTTVRPGQKILISMYAMGRLEWLWGKDYQEFKPERWVDDKGRISQDAMSKFYPFTVGPRACPGRNMAFTQMKSAAAAVLFNFCIEVVEGQIVNPMSSIVLHMKNGVRVRIKQRVW
ncbi:PREDICTED: alkane hydroxylase MAH1-like [Nelumbo nucifera]|uniref:Alkane hydroxylase MAH1-like n=1 Tax=Nelumbo nucifera TaxID=4432 RepID=A0A1U8B0C9_NELNU|nr:PREDICTED: alkane hydroxylase MAH1-like [Nelumbo nucifera]